MAKKPTSKKMVEGVRHVLNQYRPTDISQMVEMAFARRIEHADYHMVESHCVEVSHRDGTEGYVFCTYGSGSRTNMATLTRSLKERVSTLHPGSMITTKELPREGLYCAHWLKK